MKLSVTLFLALFATLFCAAQCQLSGSTLYSLDTVNSQLRTYSFANKATNVTYLDFTNFITVVQGNYGTLDKKFVVYLDSAHNINVGYININTGSTTQVATYQTPVYLNANMLIPSSFGYDIITGNVYCLAVVNTKVFMMVLSPNVPAFVVNTGLTDSSTTGSFDPVSENYYILTVQNNQYVVSVYTSSNKTVSTPYVLKSQWMIYSEYQSSIIAYNGQAYIVQLVPPATNYLFQVVLDENKPQITQLTTSNLSSYYFDTLSVAITNNYIFYVSSGSAVPNSILNTYQLNGISSTSLITLPFSLTATDYIFVQ